MRAWHSSIEEDVYPFNSWRCRHEPNSGFETQSKLVSLKQISATFFKSIMIIFMHMVFLRCVPISCVYVSDDINLSWTRDLECRRLAKWRCQEDSEYKKVAHELAINFQLSRIVNVLYILWVESDVPKVLALKGLSISPIVPRQKVCTIEVEGHKIYNSEKNDIK